jgi:vitamin B12 transporter
LYQLFDPLYGNEGLLPEENTTLEGGLSFTTENNFTLSAVYFNRNEEQFVDFVLVDPDLFTYQYVNTPDTFEASGIEVEASKRFGKKLRISANYTNTQADERFSFRIPEHKLNAAVGFQVTEASFIGVHYQFNSEREDTFFNPTTFESESIVLESYGLLDVSATTKISNHLTLFAGVTNILNEEYQEAYHYQTLGRNVRAGFTIVF